MKPQHYTILTLTDSAIEQLEAIIPYEDNDKGLKLYFRVAVKGGKCSGLRYAFDVTSEVNDDDQVIQVKRTTGRPTHFDVVIDNKSLPYLRGSKVDYQINPSRQGFVIDNPNAKGICGCGDSFEA